MVTIARPEIRTGLADVLAAGFAATSGDDPDLSAVQVNRQDPGTSKAAKSVTIAQISGPIDVVGFAGQSVIDDLPVARLIFEVRGVPGAEEADTICKQMLQVALDVLFAPGGPDLGVANVGLYPSELDGPNPYRDDNGHFTHSGAVLSIQIKHQPR